MRVFDFEDYKEVLATKIRENSHLKAYRSLLAEKMGCQKSFFSQVMNSHVHITPDHAAMLAQFWGLNEDETTYFTDMVLLARAGTQSLRSMLRTRMKRIKSGQGNPSQKFQWPQLTEAEGQQIYYSSWYWSAIHIGVSIQKFKSAVEISKQFDLPLSLVENALRWLEKSGLIKQQKQGWEVTGKFLHLPNSSYMNEMHHFNWRQRAIANLQKHDPTSLHYSSVFSLTEEDFHKLKEMTVSYIDSLHKVAGPSRSEELVSFSCDLFKVV